MLSRLDCIDGLQSFNRSRILNFGKPSEPVIRFWMENFETEADSEDENGTPPISGTQGRRQRGGPVVPGPPFEICAPHFILVAWLLHTSNTVFKNCTPLLGFDSSFCFLAPPAAKLWRRACWYLSQSLRSMMKSFRITVCLCLFLIIPTLCQLILEIHT